MSGTVLVTGAGGFVGRHVVRALAANGHAVRAVVRRGGRPAPPESAGVLMTDNLFVEDGAWWADAFRDVEVAIHLAWYVQPGTFLTSPDNTECQRGTVAMARAAIACGVRRVVGVGTCYECDVSRGEVSPHAVLDPRTPYAAAKAAAYRALAELLPAQGVEFAWCRLFCLYGEGEDPRRLLPYVHQQLAAGERVELSDGEQVRDYLDVREAARQIADVALGDVQGPVNVCSGIPVTVRALVEGIADSYGRRDLLAFGARAPLPFDPPFVVGVASVPAATLSPPRMSAS